MSTTACCPALAALALCSACSKPPENVFPGYAEGEYVRLASPLAGTLLRVHLRSGDSARAGEPAFALEHGHESAARQEAASRLLRAEALLADLRKGARTDELAVIAAELRAAQSALALSRANLARDTKLAANAFIAPARIEQARAGVTTDQTRVQQAAARLRTAQSGARGDQVAAAEQEAEAARAQLAQAEWQLTHKTQSVPTGGLVSEVAYRVGEWVPAGAPVVTILPAANIKVRFFIPEGRLARVATGQGVIVSCDGCAPLKARISFVAPQAEFTSPLIYSAENRAALVFMLEATPDAGQAQTLHPGQPVSVSGLAR